MSTCIPKCNWENFESIINDVDFLIGREFKSSENKIYTFHGVLWGIDDFYYEMYDGKNRKFKFLSCCLSLDQYEFNLIEE